jgi:hypothetical protein
VKTPTPEQLAEALEILDSMIDEGCPLNEDKTCFYCGRNWRTHAADCAYERGRRLVVDLD